MNLKDWGLLGLALDISGAVVLAKGFIAKSLWHAFYESRTMSGGNVFILKSALFQRAEAIAGAGLLVAGFVLQIVGSHAAAPAHVFDGIIGWCGLGVVAASLSLVGVRIAAVAARRTFLRYMFRNAHEPKIFSTPSTPQEEEGLTRLGLLYDMPKRRDESLEAFTARLNSYFRAAQKHAGKLKAPMDFPVK
jgi:hypothetical protein